MGDFSETKDRVDRMNEYRDLQQAARVLRENALEADDAVDSMKWIAAGGRGGMPKQKLLQLAEGLQKNAETLAELAEEAPDPREVKENAE